MNENDLVFVGMDVSKAHLDVAVHGESEVRQVANNESGIEALVAELAERKPSLVVLEATGGFEMPNVYRFTTPRSRPSGRRRGVRRLSLPASFLSLRRQAAHSAAPREEDVR